MNEDRFVLGIDTSNYKTSLAVICGDEIIIDKRRFLTVKPGEKGLRQSEALFQHTNNLPEMFEELLEEFEIINSKHSGISAVAFSSSPRPVKGSYMPCFLAGRNLGVSLASVLSVPVFSCSHQEGHIEAIRRFIDEDIEDKFLACHFSGGTLEILDVISQKNGYQLDIVGGTKDISFGQVLDRIGTSLGLDFPCGEELDKIALSTDSATHVLSPVKVKEGKINLSGFESQIQRHITKEIEKGNSFSEILYSGIINEVFISIASSINKMINQISSNTNRRDIIMSGGVSSSVFLRELLANKAAKSGINLRFDNHNLSSDNAVGVALLGSRCIWD